MSEAVVVVLGAVECGRGVCDVISKRSFPREAEAAYLTVNEGVFGRRARALGGEDGI